MEHPLRILMATMSLDLGGAETHIVELCRALRRRGHTLVVVSAGGTLVPLLEREGVRHVEAPLHRRSLRCMAQARAVLADTLDAFQPDVVHNHARIPGFLLAPLCRKRRIPQVSTVHGSYKVSPLLRMATRWGDKALAVSADIEQYLISEYGYAERDIFLTVNGIDTDTFRFDADLRNHTRASLGIGADTPVILSVSRLDEDSSGGVRRLIESAGQLRRLVPGVQLLIVGGGTQLSSLQALAAELTANEGVECITFTGPRSDIAALCCASDVFVGVSRAALEAAACERPVVLLGTFGSLGVLDNDTLQQALDTNFTCRGHTFFDSAPLAQIIADLVHDARLQGRLGAFGSGVVAGNYSVTRMADDAIASYRAAKAACKGARYDFLLCGYYGYGNAGDELLLSVIVDNLLLRKPDAAICVLNRSRDLVSCSRQVALARRFSPFELLSAIRRSKLLMFGGGNLLQDITSAKSLTYYLFTLWLAKAMGCKTMLYGNGIGPLQGSLGKKLTARVLRHVDTITLREPDSAALLQSLGISPEHVFLTADEVFTALMVELDRPDGLPAEYVAVSLRAWQHNDPAFTEKVAGALDVVAQRTGLAVILVPFQPSLDTGICRAVSVAMRQPSTLFAGGGESALSVITHAKLVLGMRLHALIFATAAGIPCVGLVYDPKVRSFLAMAENTHFVECTALDETALRDQTLSLLENYEAASAHTQRMAHRLRGMAQQNVAMAFALLERQKGEADG